MNKLILALAPLFLGIGGKATAQDVEFLNPRTEKATNLEEALQNNNNNSYPSYYFGSEMGIQGRKINLIVDGKYYSVNADELPEYDEEGKMKLGEYTIGPSHKRSSFFRGRYIDPNKSYPDELKQYLWFGITDFLLGIREWHLENNRYEEARIYDEQIASSFAKTLFFLDKKRLRNFRHIPDNPEYSKMFTSLRNFKNSLEGFIAQIATEAYETLDYVEPSTNIEDIERRYVKPHQAVSGLNDGSKLLGELGISFVDEFVQRTAIHKDKIDRDKISIEHFEEYKILEYQQKIIRDLQEHLQNLSTDELLFTLASEEEFVENLTMPLWSKYLSCSPKWAATVIAISELDYFLRTVNYPEQKNFNFSIDEIDKFTNLNLYTLLWGRRFNCNDYINALSKKSAFIYKGSDRIYESIEKQITAGGVCAFPKDRAKVDELKRKQPKLLDLPGIGDSPFHGSGYEEIYKKHLR